MQQRFRKEGLDFEALKAEDRLLQVWRWLVDAESNLKNSRRMLDKLHEQQNEEIEVIINKQYFLITNQVSNFNCYQYLPKDIGQSNQTDLV